MTKDLRKAIMNKPILIQTVFHASDPFLVATKSAPKKLKNNFFQDKFYSLKAHAHYFTVLISFATWRAAKRNIFNHFKSINLPRCRQSINSLIRVSYSVGEGGGRMEGCPPSYNFFQKPPHQNQCPPMGCPPLKNEVPPIWKTPPPHPHWNMKHPSMKWFLEKAQ